MFNLIPFSLCILLVPTLTFCMTCGFACCVGTLPDETDPGLPGCAVYPFEIELGGPVG